MGGVDLRGGLFLGLVAFTLALVVNALLSGNYLNAIGWIFAGIAVASLLCSLLFGGEFPPAMHACFGGIAAAFFFMNLLVTTPLLDSRRLEAQMELGDFFLKVAAGMYGSMPQEVRNVAEVGFRVCMTQRYFDQVDFAMGAQEILYFGPGISMVWEAGKLVFSHTRRPVECGDILQHLVKLRPALQGLQDKYGDAVK